MNKKLLTAVVLLGLSLSPFAQKGTNKVGIGGEIAIPAGGEFGQAFNTGFGGWVKFLAGVGSSGYVSFSTGFTSFQAKGSNATESASISILPLMLGYRHIIISGLYVEPQAGYGSYRAKYKLGGESASGSQGAFTYAVGMGYELNEIDFGIRYQNGSIEGINYGNVALRIGYNFALKNKSVK